MNLNGGLAAWLLFLKMPKSAASERKEREPMTIQSIRVKALRPTQIAVGRRLVHIKRRDLLRFARQPQELVEYILQHPIRVVLGPRQLLYVIDHHHLGLALLKEKFKTAPVQVEADLSGLKPSDYWPEMAKRAWVHPYDGDGKERPIDHIPGGLEDMQDDPYRSLAGLVRERGGFKKVQIPYAEFQWADYFRPLIKRKLVKTDFKEALRRGLNLARAPEAARLPGYIGKPT